jgi:phosphocarrier protein HPr
MMNAGEPDPNATGADAPGTITRIVKIVNSKGLHARPSAKFVQLVEKYDARLTVSYNGETVNGDSLMGLVTFAAGTGSQLTLKASGPQAKDVLDAIAAFVASKFGEED